MGNRWKYAAEKIGIPLGIWFITSIVTQLFRKYGDISMIRSLFQTFVIELWPIWIGAICVALYLIVRSLINFHQDYESVKNAIDRMNKLEVNFNELKEWIGLFSYKGRYSDLKGKIQCYIKDELEKESTDQKDETRKYKALDKLQGLDYEEAFGKLTPDERERYLQYKDKE